MPYDEIQGFGNTVSFDGYEYKEFAGKGNDKPTGKFLNGSLLHEVNEKQIYAWDRAASEWVPQVQLSDE